MGAQTFNYKAKLFKSLAGSKDELYSKDFNISY